MHYAQQRLPYPYTAPEPTIANLNAPERWRTVVDWRRVAARYAEVESGIPA